MRRNRFVWDSWEAGNLPDSTVIKAHLSSYSACHEVAVKTWNPSHSEYTSFSDQALKEVVAMLLMHTLLSCCKVWNVLTEQ